MILKNLKVSVVERKVSSVTNNSDTPKRVSEPSNLIKAKTIEVAHTKFKVCIDNRFFEVVVIDYKPTIIFSSKLNDHWKYPKPSITANIEAISELSIYWDYLYDGMEVKGLIKDDKFVLNNEVLKQQVKVLYKKYITNVNHLNKIDKLDRQDYINKGIL